MNILHFGSNYRPDIGGNVVRMTNMLEDNQCGNKLFILTTAQANGFDDTAYFQRTGVTIIRICKLSDAKTILPNIVSQFQIDIVVTHVIPANLIACRVLPKNVVLMTEVHSLIDSGKMKNLAKMLLHRFYINRKTEKYFVLSQGAAAYLQKNYGLPAKKIQFLPNGYQAKSTTYQSGNPNYFTFGYAGTFYTWQGIDVLCDAIDEILSIDQRIRVYLIGGGQREEALREKAKNSNGRFVVTGLIPRNELEVQINEIDVLMIPRPSTLETETAIPLKIFDSIECGKAVIMSNVFGLTEVLSDKEAIVYDKHNPKGLVQACRQVFENPQICQETYANAVLRLQKWPSWREIHQKQHQVFQEHHHDT